MPHTQGIDNLDNISVSGEQNQKKKKIPAWFRVLQSLHLLPILACPFVLFMSIFIFDDPTGNPTTQYIIFFLMNSYSLVLIVGYYWCGKKYHQYPKATTTWLLWPLIIIAVLGYFWKDV